MTTNYFRSKLITFLLASLFCAAVTNNSFCMFKGFSDWWRATSRTEKKTIYQNNFDLTSFDFKIQRRKILIKDINGNIVYWAIEAFGTDQNSGRNFLASKNLETGRFLSQSIALHAIHPDGKVETIGGEEEPIYSQNLLAIMQQSVNKYEEEYSEELKNLKNKIILNVKVRKETKR